MKRPVEILCGISTVVFLSSFTVWIFCFSKINNDYVRMEISWPILCAAAVVFYLIDYLMIAKRAPVVLYLLLQPVMVAIGVWLCITGITLEPFHAKTVVITCVIFSFVILSAAYIAYFHVHKTGVLIRFDLSAFMVILLLILEKWLVFPARLPALILCILSLGLSLLSIIFLHFDRYGKNPGHVSGSRRPGKTLFILCILAVLLCTVLIVLFCTGAMEHAASGIIFVFKHAWLGLLAGIKWFYHLVYRFFMTLFSGHQVQNLPDSDYADSGFSMNLEEEALKEMPVPVWFYIILGVIVAAVFVLIVLRLRRIRFRNRRMSSESSEIVTTRESHLRSAFAELFQTICQKIRFLINRIRYRRTVPGMVMWCERHASKDQKRKTMESAPAFLRRLAESSSSEESREELLSFADLTEQYFYAPSDSSLENLPAARIKRIRSSI